jgi:fibronectin type 3 domain-containing protein
MPTVNLTWTANTETDLAGYKLYRGLGASAPTFLAAFPKTATSGSDATVPNTSQTVTYNLTAVDNAGNESAHSAVATVTVDATPPQAPTGLTAVLA